MPDEPAAMREIHEIRERLYRRRQGMSRRAYLDEVNEIGGALAEKLGLRVVGPASRKKDDDQGNGATPEE